MAEKLPRLNVSGKLEGRNLENFLRKLLDETGFLGLAYDKLCFLWKSLGFCEENIRKLKSRFEGARIRACFLLGTFGADTALRMIRECLEDVSEKVRWAAAYSLLRLHDEKSLSRILESVGYSGSGRFSLIQLQRDLYTLGREGVFSLEEALQHPEPDMRILALGIAGSVGQMDLMDFIVRLLEDPVLDVRMKALSALIQFSRKKEMKDPQSELPQAVQAVLATRLAQSSWEETARILQVIGSWKISKFIPEIENQATHLHPWVRYRALETLLQMGEEGRKRIQFILSEHRHIVFPILEDLDVKNDI
ncbi:MAG: HEAT repeat domain-containing protein [Candidatus Omnitrophica bacterium]|nr:HEAT repeat domain-containing protein [Candidatus Omnitrophota bacterium]